MSRGMETVGNIGSVSVATIATITNEDYRLWTFAIISLGISAFSSIYRLRKDKYESIRKRAELCTYCKENAFNCSDKCTVTKRLRPSFCIYLHK